MSSKLISLLKPATIIKLQNNTSHIRLPNNKINIVINAIPKTIKAYLPGIPEKLKRFR